jgi:basic membrane lipoprotein Med (substrate-binding protein (PBP1-ABC) superfamily)
MEGRNVKQQVRLLSLLAALVLVLAACGGSAATTTTAGGAEPTTTAGAEPTTTAGAEPTTTAAPATDVSVGLIFDIGGRGDQSFNDSAAAGIERAEAELGITFTEASPNDDGSNRAELLQLAADSSNLVIGVGFLFDLRAMRPQSASRTRKSTSQWWTRQCSTSPSIRRFPMATTLPAWSSPSTRARSWWAPPLP